MAFKFDKNCQTAALKSRPNKLYIRRVVGKPKYVILWYVVTIFITCGVYEKLCYNLATHTKALATYTTKGWA